jgi:hypothetical protein
LPVKQFSGNFHTLAWVDLGGHSEEFHKLVGSQTGLVDDGQQCSAFKVFIVKGESNSAGRVVRMFQNVMAPGDGVYKESTSPYAAKNLARLKGG